MDFLGSAVLQGMSGVAFEITPGHVDKSLDLLELPLAGGH